MGLSCWWSLGSTSQVTLGSSFKGDADNHESWMVTLDPSRAFSDVWHLYVEARACRHLQGNTKVQRLKNKINSVQITSQHGQQTSCCTRGLTGNLLLVFFGEQQEMVAGSPHLLMHTQFSDTQAELVVYGPKSISIPLFFPRKAPYFSCV